MMCHCGCNQTGVWLCSGNDFDPSKPQCIGQRFENEPACATAAEYMEETALALEMPFEKKPIQ